MNFNRILTTVIGLPIVILVFVFGNIYLIDILFALIALMSLHEYFDSFKEKAKPVRWLRLFILYVIVNYTYSSKRIYNYYNRYFGANNNFNVIYASYFY